MKLTTNRSLFALSLLIGLSTTGLLQTAHAQSVLPPQMAPGSTSNPAYDPNSENPGGPALIPGSTIQGADGSNPNAAQQPAIVETTGTSFMVNHIEVQGNSIIKDDEIRKIVGPYEGKELSSEDLTSMVSAINTAYQKKGFTTSLAYVPPQDLERGTVTIKILEGTVGEMEVTGNKYFKARVISNQLSETPGKPLNIPALEQELVRINQNEPYRIKATLSPGESTGETKLHFDVKEQQPFQIALVADNAGRPYIGTYRYGVQLMDRNVSGIGDRFDASWMMAAGQQIASTSYTRPLNRYGTELSGLFGFSHVNVDLQQPDQPEIIGSAYSYGLLLSQPLDKSRTWVADLGLNYRRVSSYFDGDKTSRDNILSTTLGLNFNKFDRYGRTFARAQGTLAPDWLGANRKFWKTEAFFTRVTRLPKNNLLLLRGYTQLTSSDLPPVEQYQLGGENTVRGYTEGLVLGDRGYNASAEWRWPVPFLSKASPWLSERLQGAFFVDYGQAWLSKGNNFRVTGLNYSNTSLLSAGVGFRARLTDYLQGFVDVGFGLLNRKDLEPNNQPTARIHFGVRSELLSNDYKSRTTTVTPIKTAVARPKSVGTLMQSDLQAEVADPTLEPVDFIHNSGKVN